MEHGRRQGRQSGFTLIELVVVIVLSGIIAALGGMLIAQPLQGYVDLARRAELVDSAESALRRMQRDIRQALPNSIRLTSVGGVEYLELLHTVDGGRYRSEGAGDILDFDGADGSFDVLGALRSSPPAGEVVVYNLTATGGSGNAYLGDNRTAVTGGSDVSVAMAPIRFPRTSPYQRFFLIDGPVSFVCAPTPAGGTLRRQAGYAIANVQPTAFGGGSAALLAKHVTACAFTHAGGSSQRSALVTIALTLEEAGEQVTLLQQVHVDNAP